MPLRAIPECAVDGVLPSRVVAPADVEELAAALRTAHRAGEAVVPWGGGTRMHVGGVPRRYDVALDLTGLDRVLEYEPADLTATVEAGIPLAPLQARLASQGQRLAFDPPFPDRATVGGSLASNAVGPLRAAFGGARDLVIGMKIAQADGIVTKSGGKVVKNVSGYDLMRPHIGAFGTLGVIAEVSFKLVPLPAASRTFAAVFGSVAAARAACEALLLATFQPERFVLLSGGHARRPAGRWRGTGGDHGGETWLLVLTLAAGRNAVERMVREAGSLVTAARPIWHDLVDEAESARFWAGLEPAAPALPLLTSRATFKPSSGFDFVTALEDVARRGGVTIDTTFHVGFGTVLAHCWAGDTAGADPPDVELASRAADSLRRLAAANGAVAVLERCPTPLKARIDVWGDPGGSIVIMRGMKGQFDPAGVLNPGRFVGGI